MDWQLIAVALLVAAATAYLGHATWRSWWGKRSGCGGGCGCRTTTNASEQVPLITSDQLTARLSGHKRPD